MRCTNLNVRGSAELKLSGGEVPGPSCKAKLGAAWCSSPTCLARLAPRPLDGWAPRDHVWEAVVSILPPRVRFEQTGSRLTAVEIVRSSRSPVIASLHRALLALGIVVSSYQARSTGAELLERVVLERGDGGSIEEELSERTKNAVLHIAADTSG